jgi:predicted ATPase/class 3 adenylate cyclase
MDSRDSLTIIRKLAAILSVDVHRHLRRTDEDDTATFRVLTIYRRVLAALIHQYRGKVVDSPGDNLLAEFDSVVEALQCAVSIQERLKNHAPGSFPHQRIQFHMGLNLGDVQVVGEQISGDGVNIAERLADLVEDGGICVSGTVYDQVENKLPFYYQYLGEHVVANLTRPIRVYRVQSELSARVEEATPPDYSTAPLLARTVHADTVRLVGREAVLAQMQHCLEKAMRGERQVFFLTGEPGIGKTTVVDAFLERLGLRQNLWITQGQCVEHYGSGEAYLPVLEALGRLGREREREEVVATLAQYAPTWLAQLPGLVGFHQREGLQHTLFGATQERMLRELTDALEMLATRHPLVIVLEDLHWSDHSTVESLAYLAQRRGPARLLVVGTYRPEDVLASGHPLKGVVQELQARGRCEGLRLELLQKDEISAYVHGRFAKGAREVTSLQDLATLLHQRTGGNPLFMVNMVEHLLHEGVIAEADGQWHVLQNIIPTEVGVPDSLRQLIEKQFERLTPAEQQVLEAASVAGVEFSSAALAAALTQADAAVEEWCADLAAKGQFLRATGIEEWPDGTIGGRYSFLHALYQQVMYERVPVAQRIRFHQRIGLRKETAYDQQAGEIASELAAHFAAGHDYQRAVRYLGRAGETAIRRHAPQEALRHLTKGLELLHTLPDTIERAQQELTLQRALGAPLIATKGYTAPEVGKAYMRAQELCRQIGDTSQLFPVLYGLSVFHVVRAELPVARALGEQLFSLAESQPDSTLVLEAHQILGLSLFYLGEFAPAWKHLERCIALYDPQQHRALAFLYGHDHGVVCLSYAAWVLWVLGHPDQARERSDEALTLAQELSHPFSRAFALNFAALLQQCCGTRQTAREQIETLVALASEEKFAFYSAHGTVLQGWLRVEQEQQETGIAQMCRGLATLQTLEVGLRRPYYLALLAELYGDTGQIEEGLAALAEALETAHTSGERFYEAELYRIKGQLTLQKFQVPSSKFQVATPQHSTPSTQEETEAEEHFHKALEIARRQQAKSLELRAAMSLARLWRRQGKVTDARQLLAGIYGWFTEGFDTTDLQAAATLLTELGGTTERPPRKERRKQVATGRETLATSTTTFSPPETFSPSAVSPAPSVQLFRKEGEYWTVTFQGTTCHIKHTAGVQYLAQLLQYPNQEFHAVSLASGGVDPLTVTASGHSTAEKTRGLSESVIGSSDAGEVLDPQARAAYKRRIEDLRAELEEARIFNDPGRTARAQEELDFLTQELARAVGFAGRARKAASPGERARVNVTRAIKTAIEKIGKSHPPLGQHLTRTIKTGTFCSYVPDPHLSLSWQF